MRGARVGLALTGSALALAILGASPSRAEEPPPPVTITVSESIGVSDGPAAEPPPEVEVTESIGVGDGVVVVPPATTDIAEGVGVADAVQVVPPATAADAEGVVVTDTVVVVPPAIVAINENVGVSDGVLVEVLNSPPTAAAGGPYTVDEGSAVVLTGSGTDPDGDPLTFGWTPPDSLDDPSSATPSFTGVDDDVVELTLTVTDPGGLSDTSATTVTVTNVPPAVTAGPDQTALEGSTVTLAASFTDPGTADTHTVAVDWGDGASASTLDAAHAYADDSTYTATVTVTDDDGGVGTDTLIVSVDNVEPTVDAGADQTVDEGSTVTLAASFTDPGTADTHTVAVDWDDGATGAALDAAHAYADDGTYTVTVSVTDDDGGVGIDTLTVTVGNVEPSLGPITAPTDPVAVNTAITASAAFTDPGTADSHTASFSWGDGSSSGGSVAGGIATGTHAYTIPGIYTITLTVTDDDGGSDARAFQFVVVYSPDGGFVTGGGWINSPAGAYVDDPTLVDKANFGFVSKHKKGATTPSGVTEFQFSAAGLNFHSDEYQWLVVSGARAQYKGSGTLNGVGGYGFMISAVDGQVTGGGGRDMFRIKIWAKASGDVVYDNQPAAPDDADPTTVLGGGSIVIHKG